MHLHIPFTDFVDFAVLFQIATKKKAIKDAKKELKVLKNQAKESKDAKVMKYVNQGN